VQTRRAVGVQQYHAPDATGAVRWREEGDAPPPARLIHAPYDPEARYSTKGQTPWVGDKVHLTETCDPDRANLITDVLTTEATSPDENKLPVIEEALKQRNLLPSEHLVDAGYTGEPFAQGAEERQLLLN